MALEGRALLTQTLNLAQIARQKLANLPGLKILTFTEPQPGFRWFDPTRLTVDLSQWGLTGFEVDEMLREEWGVTAELPTLRQLSFIISLGNSQEDIEALGQAFWTLSNRYPMLETNILTIPPLPPSHFTLSPRDAFFAGTETVKIENAIARISAELICPYPPGIPLLIPGEVITAEALDYLQTVQQLGGIISGCSDSSLKTFQVISQ
jgi:lysine decarboxylase